MKEERADSRGSTARADRFWQQLREALVAQFRRRRRLPSAVAASVEDHVQEGLMVLWAAIADGETVGDPLAFVGTIVHRRCMDEIRRRGPAAGSAEEILARVPDPDSPASPHWADELVKAGFTPSEAASRLLAAIGSGVRGNHRLAEFLDRDVKAIREGRQRWRKWLEVVRAEITGDPLPRTTNEWGVPPARFRPAVASRRTVRAGGKPAKDTACSQPS